MKKILMIVVFLFVLAGCSKQVDKYDVVSETKDLHVQEVGDVVKLDVDFLKERYDYDQVEFHSSNVRVARINYKEELLALRGGKAEIEAKLYKGKDLVCVVEMGTYFVLDDSLEGFTPINTFMDLQNIKASGLYYLNADIRFHLPNLQISTFEGIILNPNEYKIYNPHAIGKLSSALFKNINNAYIEGLQFLEVAFDETVSKQHVLAENITSSYIKKISFQGSFEDGIHTSPLAFRVEDSILDGVSFEGEMRGGKIMGGVAGNLIRTRVSNVTIDATFTTAVANASEIGGISAYIEGGSISNSVIRSAFQAKANDVVSVVATGINQYYYLWNISHYASSHSVYNEALCLNPRNITILEKADVSMNYKWFDEVNL